MYENKSIIIPFISISIFIKLDIQMGNYELNLQNITITIKNKRKTFIPQQNNQTHER